VVIWILTLKGLIGENSQKVFGGKGNGGI